MLQLSATGVNFAQPLAATTQHASKMNTSGTWLNMSFLFGIDYILKCVNYNNIALKKGLSRLAINPVCFNAL